MQSLPHHTLWPPGFTQSFPQKKTTSSKHHTIKTSKTSRATYWSQQTLQVWLYKQVGVCGHSHFQQDHNGWVSSEAQACRAVDHVLLMRKDHLSVGFNVEVATGPIIFTTVSEAGWRLSAQPLHISSPQRRILMQTLTSMKYRPSQTHRQHTSTRHSLMWMKSSQLSKTCSMTTICYTIDPFT